MEHPGTISKRTTPDGIAIVQVTGKLKAANVEQFEAVLDELAAGRQFRVLLDFSALEFLNSKAVGLILRFLGAARQAGGDIAILRVNDQVLQVFRLLTLDKLLRFSDDEAQAIAMLKGATSPQ